jgi:hypothetical protein
MVTRRAVLKGTAAASIGAIAAAHGATPVEAATLSCGFGNLQGGAFGGFYKEKDAFQVAVKFSKIAIEVFIKEVPEGGVAIFSKFFEKHWTEGATQLLSVEAFPDLKSTELSFSKITPSVAEFFVKTDANHTLQATIGTSKDGIFYKYDELPSNPDGEIG